MASNLSTIGFVFANNDDFSNKMVELAEKTQMQASCAAGHYAVWSELSGAQLWFHIAPGKDIGGDVTELEILGLTPFFAGQSEVSVNITAPVQRGDDNGFEGGFYAWVGPDESGEGVYPMVFDAVDFAMHGKRKLPFRATVQLSGFARELTAYATRKAFESAEADRLQLAAQSFIPMGIFAASSADQEPGDKLAGEKSELAPSPTAMLTGIVTAHHVLINAETGRKFHWLVVKSFEASFDIVADPEVISGEIVEGGVVEVACWFFGRILD